MPFISFSVGTSPDALQQEKLKTELGRLIEILPGKSENVLMIDICGGHTLYFRGEKKKRCAFIDVRLYKESPLAAKQEFTEKLTLLTEEILGIPRADIFVSILEFANWGAGGTLK
jgi:phenylpyruvate tautomerase PptA (4-oxalocrotonate tautomerase family)